MNGLGLALSALVVISWGTGALAADLPAGHYQPIEELEVKPAATLRAASAIRLAVETIRPDKPVVGLMVSYPQTASYVALTDGSQELQRLAPDVGAAQVEQLVWLDVPTDRPLRVTATAYDADGTALTQSAPLIVDPREFAPPPWQVAVRPNQVTQRLDQVKLLAPDNPEGDTWVEFLLNGKPIHQVTAPRPGDIAMPPISVPKGKSELTVVTHNAWGASSSKPVSLFNFGVKMPGSTYVLVDKFNMTLYFVKDGQLKRTFPIAIGRPRTPTPTGMFIMGRKEIMPYPYTGWGVLRLMLYRENQYAKRHWSGYAIHGTNQPSSIGTEASHGCVRMFNQDVTQLSKEIPLATPVLIQERLEVNIDEVRSAAREE